MKLRKLEWAVRRLFDGFQEEGWIRLLYDARPFMGRVAGFLFEISVVAYYGPIPKRLNLLDGERFSP